MGSAGRRLISVTHPNRGRSPPGGGPSPLKKASIMANHRKSKPTPPDDYVPEGFILMEADRVLGRVLAALPGVRCVVDHGIHRASRHAMAVVYVSTAGKQVAALTVVLRSYDGPAFGILEGSEILECEDLGDAIRQVAFRVEAASQLSLAF